MTRTFPYQKQPELAPGLAVDITKVRSTRYGRRLGEFTPGQILVHPRGLTIDRSQARWFAQTFLQANPLYLNVEFARRHGFDCCPLSPQHVFNVVLSLGVQNNSEQAIANLGYYDAAFLRPVYPGDTLRALSMVLEKRVRGAGKPGIVTVRTVGLNQRDEAVVKYARKILIPPGGEPNGDENIPHRFPWPEETSVELPLSLGPYPGGLTGSKTYLSDFSRGEILLHFGGRTVTDEHLAWSYGVGNTHPLHMDELYSSSLSGPMSGKPIVFGGLVFSWLEGLASRDTTENALWDLGFTEGYHTQPTKSGDTLTALSRVLEVGDADPINGAGIVTFQLIGLKNIGSAEGLARYGEALFRKEHEKKHAGEEKISHKVFEIERRVLIKRRPEAHNYSGVG
jgi:2-methylfumaryl-CoA hydratase